MSDYRKPVIAPTVDTTDVAQGFAKIESIAGKAADSVNASGTKASAGVDAIGDSADRSAKVTERATNRMAAAINRASAEIQANGRNTAKFFELQGKNVGADMAALAPQLAALRKLEEAQKLASGSFDRTALSAKQMNFALRGVPAQFTDIATSIASGQNPLQVMLQQGGQLKDMFGGIGPAAKALGSYIVGLINPFTIAAAAAVGLTAAFVSGARESQGYRRELALSGNAAGLTAGQLEQAAEAVAKLGSGSQGRAAEVLNEIAKSGATGATNLVRLADAALRVETVGGQAAEETVKAFAELGKAPLTAALKLNETTNFLTRSTYEHIKALEEQGKTVEAGRVAQDEYLRTLEGITPKVVANLGSIERGWNGIVAATKKVIDTAKGIGRELGPEQRLAANATGLERIRNAPASDRFFGPNGAQVAGKSAAIQAYELDRISLLEIIRLERSVGEQQAMRTQEVKDSVAWNKEVETSLTKQKRAQIEIAKVEELGARLGKSRAEIETQIAAIRAKYADKTKPSEILGELQAERDAAKQWAAEFIKATDAIAEADGKVQKLTKSQVDLVKYLQSPGYSGVSEAARQINLELYYDAIGKEQIAEANKEVAKTQADAAREYKSWLNELQKGATSAEKHLQDLADEDKAVALVIPGYRSLKQAIVEVQIARLRERQQAMLGNPDAVLAVQQEIDALTLTIEQIGNSEARQEAKNKAKEAKRDWEHAAKDIENTLTGAFARSFEAGRGLAENLASAINSIFMKYVIEPIIGAALAPLTSTLATTFLPAIIGATPRASGGPVAAHSLQQVNELGFEVFSTGGHDYLMTGSMGGNVIPNSSLRGTSVTLVSSPQITIDARSDQAQVAALVAVGVQQGNKQMLDRLHAQGMI